MAPLPGYGPQRPGLLWISSHIPPPDGAPHGLFPKSWDGLETAGQGCGHPGPQGKPAATRGEVCQGSQLSTEVQQKTDLSVCRDRCYGGGQGDGY